MSPRSPLHLICALAILAAMGAGCATTKPPTSCEDVWERPDPFSFWNRPMHGANRWIDRTLVDPLIDVWLYVPSPVRNRFTDFAGNLRAPRNAANNLLQADFVSAGTELMRFVMNSTIGVVGLFDVAKPLTGYEADREDFGQTLAIWGVGAGPLLEIPLSGPQSLREFGGGFADTAFSITTFAPGAAAIPLDVMSYANKAERRAKLDDVLDVAFEMEFEDSYREAQCLYFKRRIYRILDGEIPRKKIKEDVMPPLETATIEEPAAAAYVAPVPVDYQEPTQLD